MPSSIFKTVRARAKRLKIEFKLEPSDIVVPTLCPVLNIPILYGTPSGKRKGGSDNSPSVDRINPKLGYVKGNVKVISKRANLLKNNATVEELKLIIDYLNWSSEL